MTFKTFVQNIPMRAVTAFIAGSALAVTMAFYTAADAPACAISADKLNIIYIGVENPMSILTKGMNADNVVVSAQGGGVTLQHTDDYHYTATATTPGEARITVTGEGGFSQSFMFRVKRIPDPEIRLGNLPRSNKINAGLLREQEMLRAICPDVPPSFVFDIVSFDVVKRSEGKEVAVVSNKGPHFNAEVRALLSKAKPGDTFVFENVKAKFEGEQVSRPCGNIEFKIQ